MSSPFLRSTPEHVSADTCPTHWHATPLAAAFQSSLNAEQSAVQAVIREISDVVWGDPNHVPELVVLSDEQLSELANRMADALDQLGSSSAVARWTRTSLRSAVERALNRFRFKAKLETVYRLPGSAGTKPPGFEPQIRRNLHDGEFLLGIRLTRKAVAERDSLVDERDTRAELDAEHEMQKQAERAERDAKAAEQKREETLRESLVLQGERRGYEDGYRAALLDCMAIVEAMLASDELTLPGAQTHKRPARPTRKAN
jgi:hypothetical protein